MQHQEPYTISFIGWKIDYDKGGKPMGEAYKAPQIQGVLVTSESTRSKLTAFKTRTHWDSAASTQLTLDAEAETYFWDAMGYALTAAICRENAFEELASDKDMYEWFESLPTPDKLVGDIRHMHYFRLLQETFPESEIKLVNNGFGTHHYYD